MSYLGWLQKLSLMLLLQLRVHLHVLYRLATEAVSHYNLGSKVSLYYSTVPAIADSQTIWDLHGGSPSVSCLPPQALLACARDDGSTPHVKEGPGGPASMVHRPHDLSATHRYLPFVPLRDRLPRAPVPCPIRMLLVFESGLGVGC